jgi:FAD/FMN-containing dehydrogenase
MTTVDRRGIDVARPGDPAYDGAVQVFNLLELPQPEAAVTARTVDQVRAAVGYAADARLPVRVHTTGHASAAVRPVRGGLLVRTDLDGGVTVDPARRVARVAAGVRWGAVVAAASAHGLGAPHGSSSNVGVVGYLLRGGLSFYGREFGLAVNSVRAIELVTADGQLRRVDATADPELFWALRGGGGGFGVVTAVEIGLFPAGRVVTGASYWPITYADALLDRWKRWTHDAPRTATTSLRIMRLPAMDHIPPVLSAGPVVSVDGAVRADSDDITAAQEVADGLLGPLRAVAEPAMDNWQVTAPDAVLQAHMDPTDPVPIVGDHMLLHELDEDGAAAFLRAVDDRSGSTLILAGLRQLGGAFSVTDFDGGALNHLDARYSYAGSGAPFGAATVESLRRDAAKVRAVLTPWDTGRTAPTFVESYEQPQGHLEPADVARLDAVRRRVDPDGLFRGDITPNATALPH